MTPEAFWNESDTRKDQKFYVAFCLLESALGDYAVARDTHIHNKLNWASTTYYYSLVHALRLVCFIPLGDFPTGHSELAKLYKDGTLENRRRWLQQFIRDLGSDTPIDRISFRRTAIATYFGGNEHAIYDNKLKKWGKILDASRKCRNDSNYEGLIIAHEHVHQLVTDDFNKLANLFRKICEEILPEVILLFRIFIDKNPRKDYWYSYLNWREKNEGLRYLEDSLKFRLLGQSNVWQINNSNQNSNTFFDTINGEAIISKILEWLSPLRRNNVNNTFAEEVLNHIKLEIFDGKQSLMSKFRNQINELQTIVCGEGQNDQ